jgi:hypothetical protein
MKDQSNLMLWIYPQRAANDLLAEVTEAGGKAERRILKI